MTAEECGVNGTEVFEKRLGVHAVQRARKRHDRVVERKRIRLEVVRAEMRGPLLIQDVAQGVVENIDIRRAHRIEPGISNGEHEGGMRRPLEPTGGDADIRVAAVDGADGAINGERVDRAPDEPAVVQQPIAPQLEVLGLRS